MRDPLCCQWKEQKWKCLWCKAWVMTDTAFALAQRAS